MAKSYAIKLFAVAMFFVFISTCFAGTVLCEESVASKEMAITDGTGRTVTVETPVNHIITSGKGATATVIQLGCLDKLAVCDSYSNKDTDPVFDELHTRVSEGKILADGNCYKSGRAAYISNIVAAADTSKGGTFDRQHDVIVLTASETYVDALLVEYKEKQGKELTEDFSKVLIWYDNEIDSYDKIVDFCTKLSEIVTGSVSDSVKSMTVVKEQIVNKLNEKKITTSDSKTPAFYISMTSGKYKVGNTGSIATSMIEVSGGNPITIDNKKTGSTYEITESELLELRSKYPGKLIIYADSTMTDAQKDELYKLMNVPGSSDLTIVTLKSLWNNYSIECKNGVWAMACAEYPQYFEGDVPEYKPSNNDNTAIYVVAGIIAVVLLAGIAIYFTKHHN